MQQLLRERLDALERQWYDNRAERDRIDVEATQLSQDIAALREALQVEARLSGNLSPIA